MFPGVRLSIKIPESPIESQRVRSRPFRRLLATTFFGFLFIFAFHSANVYDWIQRNSFAGYSGLTIRNNAALSSQSEDVQTVFQTTRKRPGNRPASVEDQFKHLPDIIRVPFEEAVNDVVLQGWEDEWLSMAKFDIDKYGMLEEPKIDFVYNCEVSRSNVSEMC